MYSALQLRVVHITVGKILHLINELYFNSISSFLAINVRQKVYQL